ncbi:MAG: RHS repeat-associated core domain-containing protein [Chloroflexota bacterium]|nr:RHS repeat-associated core domain-containing protein [Chloroflexota bacterium]
MLASRTPPGTFYYLFDGLGSVVALTDSAGAVANRYAYDPYGTVTSSSGGVANPWRFGGAYGAYTDGATGLVKIGQRYYDPAVGRWTQPDPKVLPFDPVQANRYSYASCSPTNFIDPSGTSTLSCGLAMGGIIVASAGLAFALDAVLLPTGPVGWYAGTQLTVAIIGMGIAFASGIDSCVTGGFSGVW